MVKELGLGFEFEDIVRSLSHTKGGIPIKRFSSRFRLGEHQSRFFGPSYDFYDVQEYSPERDPPNQIIHSFVGTGEDEDLVFSRKCIERREVKVLFLVDTSSSVLAGLDHTKARLLLETVGYMGFTAARCQDPIGLIAFADKVLLNLPARCGQNNLYHLLRRLYDLLEKQASDQHRRFSRRTDFFLALDFISRAFGEPCFIVFISDFIGLEPVLDSSVLKRAGGKHELFFVFLDNPPEVLAAGGMGSLRIEDAETGRQMTISRRKIAELEKTLRQKRREARKRLLSIGLDSVVLEYGRHFTRLNRFLTAKHKRLRA